MAKCIKVMLMIVNTFLCVFGLALGITSVVFCVKPQLVGDVYFDDKAEKELFDNTGFIAGSAFGFGVFAVGFFGCIGAACDSVCALVTYIVMVVVLMLGCLAVGVAAVTITRVEKGKEFMRDYFREYFRDRVQEYGTKNSSKEVVDDVQQKYACCGCNNASDYKNVSGWKPTDVSPASCFDSEKKMRKEGCCVIAHEGLLKVYASALDVIGSVCFIGVVIEIIAIVFACIACCSLKKARSAVGGERSRRVSARGDLARRGVAGAVADRGSAGIGGQGAPGGVVRKHRHA